MKHFWFSDLCHYYQFKRQISAFRSLTLNLNLLGPGICRPIIYIGFTKQATYFLALFSCLKLLFWVYGWSLHLSTPFLKIYEYPPWDLIYLTTSHFSSSWSLLKFMRAFYSILDNLIYFVSSQRRFDWSAQFENTSRDVAKGKCWFHFISLEIALSPKGTAA